MASLCVRKLFIRLKLYGNTCILSTEICKNSFKTFAPSYAAIKPKKLGKGKGMAPAIKKKELDVETDPEKLSKLCSGLNYFKEGSDPELKPDSEYPDWLWDLRTKHQVPDIEELDPDTWYYWRRVRKMNLRRNNAIALRTGFHPKKNKYVPNLKISDRI